MLNERLAEVSVLRNSGLLDPEYLANALGLNAEGMGVPIEFLYLENPSYWNAPTSPLFDGKYYLDTSPDVRATDTPPLLHYVVHGFKEARSPSILIDMDHIIGQLPGGAGAVTLQEKRDVLAPYLGLRQMLVETNVDPCLFFENAVYLAKNGLRIENDHIPVEHYLRCKGRDGAKYLECSSLASFSYYMASNPDLEGAGCVPLLHFVQHGINESRKFSKEPLVSDLFLKGAAQLSNKSDMKTLKGFLQATKGTGQLAGPKWPTPYTKTRLPSVTHEARKERRSAFVGIVLYDNSEDELRKIEASLKHEALRTPGYEIDWKYLVNDRDNLSRYRKIIGNNFVCAEENLGFGRAHNSLMKLCFQQDRLYIGANPDGFFTPGSIKALLDFSDYWGDQALIEAVAAPVDHPKWHDPVTLDTAWVSGACFAIPRKLWAETGGFDPNIHMYSEDVDLSWRVRLLGGLLKVCPVARFVHDVTPRFSAETNPEKEKQRERAMLTGAYYVAQKWGGPEQVAKIRTALSRHMTSSQVDELPKPAMVAGGGMAKGIADFSYERFAPSRFWA